MLHYTQDSDIEHFIEEDVPYGDLTSNLLDVAGKRGRIVRSTRNETNVTEYAAAGIDIVVLSSVYFGKPVDIGVSI